MPSKAMIFTSDSQNPAAPADMPLYAVVENGKFTLLAVEDTPCLTLTKAGHTETKYGTREETADQLIKYLKQNPYEAGYLISLVERAAAYRVDNTKSFDDYRGECAQIFLCLDDYITRSQA